MEEPREGSVQEEVPKGNNIVKYQSFPKITLLSNREQGCTLWSQTMGTTSRPKQRKQRRKCKTKEVFGGGNPSFLAEFANCNMFTKLFALY